MTSLQVITAPAKEWIAALSRLAPAMVGKKALPVLNCVHIDPAAGSLFAVGQHVTAETDLATVHGKGEPFLISYAWLRDAITSTTGRNRNADVQVTADGKQVTVETLGYKLRAETLPVKDFPENPEHHTFASHSAVDAAELRDALNRALLAASVDMTLPILNAVNFTSGPEGLRLWATDRYRLVSDMITGPGFGDESFTIPAAALKGMVKQFKVGSVHVDSVKDGPVIFRTGDTQFVVTPTDGTYPDIRNLFKLTPETVMDVDRVQLLDAAKVANRMAERFTPAFLYITEGGVQVKFNDGLFGPDAAPLAVGTLTGAPVEIGLNTRFLLDVVNSLKGKTVRIHGGDPKKQFTFLDGGADLNDDTIYRHMVMVVRMPNNG